MMPVQLSLPLYHQLSQPEVIEYLTSDGSTGLSAEEVASRYEKYGQNELRFKPGKPAWLRFLGQFHQPLLYILLLAGTIKAFLGSWTNASVIWGVTLINAIIGYVQEAWETSLVEVFAAISSAATLYSLACGYY